MLKNKGLFIAITVASMITLSACGNAKTDTDVEKVNSNDTQITEEQENNNQPESLEEIRAKIDGINIETASAEEKIELQALYAELLNRDSLEQGDYEAYSKVCKENGDSILGYEILEEEYNLYPSNDVIERLENYICVNDEAEAMTLLSEFEKEYRQILDNYENYSDSQNNANGSAADDSSADNKLSDESLRDMITSSEWKDAFQKDDGLIVKKTICDADNTYQVSYQDSEIVVTIIGDKQIDCYKYEIDGESMSYGISGEEALDNNGAFTMANYDNEGLLYQYIKSEQKDDILCGKLECIYGGTRFEGEFDAKGKSKVEQPKEAKGYTLYATSEDGQCLFIEDEEGDFVFTAEYFEVPTIDIWK